MYMRVGLLTNRINNKLENINLINPLSPNIHLRILHTDLYTFPLTIS